MRYEKCYKKKIEVEPGKRVIEKDEDGVGATSSHNNEADNNNNNCDKQFMESDDTSSIISSNTNPDNAANENELNCYRPLTGRK